MRTSLLAPTIFALLLPLLVVFAAQLFARRLSIFSTHAEIDRRLRKDPRAVRRLLLRPWRRESMALEAWQVMPSGRKKEEFGRVLQRHDRAMTLQVGVTAMFYVAWLAASRSHESVWAVVGALVLGNTVWRILRHRALDLAISKQE